jgi:hypothetical protein
MVRTLQYLCVAAVLSPGPWLLTGAGAQYTPPDPEVKAPVRKKLWNQNIDPDGEPAAFGKSKTARFGVWRDRDGWHLRTTSDRQVHHFQGQIRVEGGSFTQVSSYRNAREKPAAHWKLKPNGQELVFDFRGNERLDGIRFKVSPGADRVMLTLRIDESDAVGQVYVGRKNQFPEVLPMSLPAWPRQAKAGR